MLPPPPERPRLPPGTATIALLTFLAALGQFSTSVYLPSFPAIARDLAAPMSLVQLTLTAYLATMAVAQLGCGPLADRFGRRPVALAGLSVYLAGSAVCTFAPGIGALMLGRVLQAAGAAAATVVSRAVMRDCFEGAEIARAMAAISIAFAAVPAAAPVIGGALEDAAGWRWAMATTVVAGVVGLALVLARLPETGRSRSSPITPSQFLGAFGPMLRDRNFRRWSLVVGGTMGGLFAYAAGAPEVFIDRFGFTATEYGLVSIVTVAGFVGGGLATRRLVARLGEARPGRAVLGLMAAGAAASLAAPLAGQGGAIAVIGALTIWAAGMGVILPIAMGAALGAAATGALHDALGPLAFPVALAGFTALAVAAFASAGARSGSSGP